MSPSVETQPVARAPERRRRSVLGVLVDAVDYDDAVRRVIDAAHEQRGFAVSALAVHGVMEGAADAEMRHRLNDFDLVVPDGQPVRWLINHVHDEDLADRVYGPDLMLRICEQAANEELPVYLFGSTPFVVDRLARNLAQRFPGLEIAGAEASRFRRLNEAERDELAARIRDSGARIAFVGLGCPRQEVFAYEMRDRIGVPLLAVGAAFDIHAGTLRPPGPLVQRMGLEWLSRLFRQPRRVWRRYLTTNPRFIALAWRQARGWQPPTSGSAPSEELRFG